MGTPSIGNTPLTAARPPASADSQDFVAEHGDTFDSVARRLGVDEEALRKANPQALNPEGLYPGQRLTIPGSPQAGGNGAAAPVDAAKPGHATVGTSFKDGAASVTQKTTAADPVEGRSADATLGATADKNGVKGTAQFTASTNAQGVDGTKVGGSSTTTAGAGFDNKGVGVDVVADKKTTTTQADGSSSGTSTSTTGNVKFGEDGLSFGGSRKNGTETQGPAGTPAKASESTEHKGNLTLSTNSIGGSVERERATATTNAQGTTTTTKHSQSGSATLGTDSFKIEKGVGIDFSYKSPGGVFGAGVGLAVNGKVEGRTDSKDGTTTSSLSAEASATAKANAFLGGKEDKAAAKTPLRWSLEGSITPGFKVSAETKVPDAEAKGKDTSPLKVNPLDPDSMPKGSQFTLNTSAFVNTDVKAGVGLVRAQTKSSSEDGFTVVAEKTDANRIRLTAGPTAALSASIGVGVDVGVASAMLGRGDKFADAKLTSAEFDLADPQGRASYREALLTGRFPTDNGAGVADVKTIQKLDVSTQAKLDGKLASFDFSIKGAGSTASDVLTTEPGKPATRETTLQFDDNVALVMTRKYDANQNELLDERRYSYKVDIDGKSDWLVSSQFMKLSAPVPSAGPVKSAQLTYTENDMRALKDGAEHAAAKDLVSDAEVRKLSGDSVNGTFAGMKPQDFAVALVKGMGSTNGADGGFVQHLKNIFTDSKVVRGADGLPQLIDDAKAQLPGRLEIR
ncbi:LysM peptidoglycan-binding domain-containing protein [Dokdonella sp.]|uniref:LysM peptidoglycan-binding domain-containing protein n=1 Tax=Dokdonella sp. TaxID=2291710 RepID=UPI001B2A7AB0|nr:LysM peptidoglycan-binding domain-containing protein [Dokdonella sp.]MBO9662187.1 LysM peptidoglycan-binding domain-containing protein [Dokdonella sp.]